MKIQVMQFRNFSTNFNKLFYYYIYSYNFALNIILFLFLIILLRVLFHSLQLTRPLMGRFIRVNLINNLVDSRIFIHVSKNLLKSNF